MIQVGDCWYVAVDLEQTIEPQNLRSHSTSCIPTHHACQCTHTSFLSAHPHMYIQDSSWPVLCHGVAMLFAMLSVSRGVSTIEPVNKVVVPILLFIIVFCFYWALFLPYSADGIIHMFSPSWSECTTWLSCDWHLCKEENLGWFQTGITGGKLTFNKETAVQQTFLTNSFFSDFKYVHNTCLKC